MKIRIDFGMRKSQHDHFFLSHRHLKNFRNPITDGSFCGKGNEKKNAAGSWKVEKSIHPENELVIYLSPKPPTRSDPRGIFLSLDLTVACCCRRFPERNPRQLFSNISTSKFPARLSLPISNEKCTRECVNIHFSI